MASNVLSCGTKDTTEADNEFEKNCDKCGEEDDKPEKSASQDENDGHLSKRQLRKLKKQEKWLLIKADKRALEKEKKKRKKREALAKGETLGPSRKRLKDNKMDRSRCQVKVAIDCFFDSYMSEKDIMKLTKQIQFCYSSNRRADNPLQYYVTGVHGQMKERLQRIGDYVNWDVNFSEENYFDVFNKEDIIYLSSDSPNVLTDMQAGKAYIIGGLVDHNHHKGLCHQLAEERGINHAQLPLTEYLDMKTRKVLTINHVFDILLRYTETNDWEKAFCAVLPERKGAKLKSNCDNKSADSDSSDDVVTKGCEGAEGTERTEGAGSSAKLLQKDKSEPSCDDVHVQCNIQTECNIKEEDEQITESVDKNCVPSVSTGT